VKFKVSKTYRAPTVMYHTVKLFHTESKV